MIHVYSVPVIILQFSNLHEQYYKLWSCESNKYIFLRIYANALVLSLRWSSNNNDWLINTIMYAISSSSYPDNNLNSMIALKLTSPSSWWKAAAAKRESWELSCHGQY